MDSHKNGVSIFVSLFVANWYTNFGTRDGRSRVRKSLAQVRSACERASARAHDANDRSLNGLRALPR